MANMLSGATAWLADTLTEHAAYAAVYRRAPDSVELSAVRGSTRAETEYDYSTKERLEAIDWLVRVEDLILDGSETKPQRGDTIQVTLEGRVETYEVMHPDGAANEPWSYVSPSQYRIHTKRIA